MILYGINPSALLLPLTQSIDITPALDGAFAETSPTGASR